MEPPLHIARSGTTSYDLGKPRRRSGLYRTVLAEDLRDDLSRPPQGRPPQEALA
ncbi:hypothetical protein [Streptomyces europaeiscabiei]|uniref:hypothetical protein n=1 Tax=Streptomyces europaeiscabiei TaxID=146819 RepID=UPI002E2E2151|nr:hypothetical protein [Streptomyces europaeiscabiei]